MTKERGNANNASIGVVLSIWPDTVDFDRTLPGFYNYTVPKGKNFGSRVNECPCLREKREGGENAEKDAYSLARDGFSG
ncbi:MAG TPA: hypothetical protein VN729_07180 [Ktedonobacteraceae bacterium]|nr:hypothetical protein [Ktedonobacteraceae bacterium]